MTICTPFMTAASVFFFHLFPGPKKKKWVAENTRTFNAMGPIEYYRFIGTTHLTHTVTHVGDRTHSPTKAKMDRAKRSACGMPFTDKWNDKVLNKVRRQRVWDDDSARRCALAQNTNRTRIFFVRFWESIHWTLCTRVHPLRLSKVGPYSVRCFFSWQISHFDTPGCILKCRYVSNKRRSVRNFPLSWKPFFLVCRPPTVCTPRVSV